MDSLQKHTVFDLVSPDSVPPEQKVVGTKWVLKVKADHTLKGRVVVRGWGQVPGIDCCCTYAPVCRIQSIRMALAINANEDWDVFQLDVQTAFLNAEVQEEVHVRTPPGYESLEATAGRPNVMKLKKSLYGLCQSPRNWFNTIDDSLRDIKFTATASDPCVYIFGSNDNLGVLTMYIDELLLLGENTPLLKNLKIQLMDPFAMTDMGDVSMVLGMQITRDREAKALTISQAHYAKSVLARSGMAGCNPVHTTGAGAELSLKQPGTMLLDSTGIQLYQTITESLMFLSQCTRYDITYAVNQLARAMSKPSKLHMTLAKHLLRYLKGDMGLAITYKAGCFEMTGYCDAGWGNNPDNGKSTSDYLFMLAGGPLSFTTALQHVTAQSTLEAELISMAHSSKEAA